MDMSTQNYLIVAIQLTEYLYLVFMYTTVNKTDRGDGATKPYAVSG